MNRCELGDCRDIMRRWISEGVTVQTCVTSPPYWGLRDYGVAGQLGLERTPEEYVANMVEVFRLVRELLAEDGTCWLVLGDSYSGYHGNARVPDEQAPSNRPGYIENMRATTVGVSGLKPKDLCGIPWRVAFALQADGWWLRSDIIWAKRAPMPESVQDRPTRSHEYLFLLAKSERYYYDAAAIREPDAGTDHPRAILHRPEPSGGVLPPHAGIRRADGRNGAGRNRRSVWWLGPEPFDGAHFAVFPTDLVKPCILAGSRPGDVILDPFMGSGTVAQVAQDLGRRWLGCELNSAYLALQDKRTPQGGLAL